MKKTKECRDFFLSHIGYFNLFDQYLILKTEQCKDVYPIIVNRTGKKFSTNGGMNAMAISSCREALYNSMIALKPEEMFRDFQN